MRNSSIAIVTDRTDLDKQITNMFHRCRLPNLWASKVFGICLTCCGRRQAQLS
ncbi:hypothetical protein [Geobacillus thermoleovorans]|uniref:hypothetical protein n=1 Tax=Geobacillus thermoleovorans TaxID=33941 RepID=UPI003D21AE74